MDWRLVLCRHTQTDHNLGRVYSGQLNVPLNQTGMAQVDTLAPQVASLGGICAVLSSDLTRAATLGHRIRDIAGVRLRLLTDLREASIGRLEGFTREEFPQKFQGDRYRTSNPAFDFTDVGGESAERVIARQLRALRVAQYYLELSGMDVARVVVVGHGTALRLLFRDHFGLIEALHEQGEYQEVPWPL